jgi:hypothetical protein
LRVGWPMKARPGPPHVGTMIWASRAPSVASVAAQSRGIPPLFKADTVNIAVSASKDGKLRVVYAGWDDANAGAHGVEARKR